MNRVVMVARFALVACVLTASCSRPADVTFDAAPDAPCASTPTFVPVTIAGSSPLGPLDDLFHFAFAGYIGACGGSPDFYNVNVWPTADTCNSPSRYLTLSIIAPFAATGASSAAAVLDEDPTGAMTDMVTFEATQLDPPDATPPHIVGHFVSHDPAWSFDIAVDLTSQDAEAGACF